MPIGDSPLGTTACRLLGLPVQVTSPTELLPTTYDALAAWSGSNTGSGAELDVLLTLDRNLAGCDDVVLTPHGDTLHLDSHGAIGVADGARHSAAVRVSPDYIGKPSRMREQLLEPMLLFLAGHAGRTPIHAAGIVANGLAILLAGPSGSGKSCLALAAQEAGFGLLSDDTVYVQLQPRLAVWGAPNPIHVFAEDAIGRYGTPRLRNGKRKIGIATRSHAPGPIRRITPCRIQRGDAVRLERTSPAEAMAMFDHPEPGFDLFRPHIFRVGQRITARGAWRLTLGRDPAAAIALIQHRIGELHAGAVA